MIFGNKNRFAIELQLSEVSHGVWMNGFAGYWVAGLRLANPGVEDSLRDVMYCLEYLQSVPERSSAELFLLGTEELITTLYWGLFVGDCPNEEEYIRRGIEGQWAKHRVDPETMSCKDWYMFLVNGTERARFLYGLFDRPLGDGREIELSIGEFEGVIDASLTYLHEEYAKWI